jgi:hypothetical protein
MYIYRDRLSTAWSLMLSLPSLLFLLLLLVGLAAAADLYNSLECQSNCAAAEGILMT